MSKSRIRERRVPLTLVFAGSSAVSLLAYVALAVAGVSVGTNLGVVGLILAVLLPLGVEVRNRTSRPRVVWFVDYRNHHFGHGIAASLTQVLSRDKRLWETLVFRPGETEPALQWQVRTLQSAIIQKVDGIVIIPAGEHQDLWHAMAALSKTGAFVIAVDSKPPNSAFRRLGVDEPRFVSAKYSSTGLLIADWLTTWLQGAGERQALIWAGPDGSWPGEERSRNIIYPLLVSGLAARLTLKSLSSWTPAVDRCRDALAWTKRQGVDVAIYCADDENALALHMVCMAEAPHLRPRMRIIGCNATSDDWGNVPALDMHAADVTVDILVREQGEAAAQMLIRERRGALSSSERTIFIQPELIVGDSSGGWLGKVFATKPIDAEQEVGRVDQVLAEIENLRPQGSSTDFALD